MGPLGMQEMIAIFVLALVLFGPKRLPELGRLLGKGLSEFRRAKSELKATFESHLNELERETRLTETPTAALPPTDYYSSSYTYPYEDQGTYETGSSHDVVPSGNFASGSPEQPATPQSPLPAPDVHQPDVHQPETTPRALPVAGTIPRGTSTLHEENPA